MHKGFGRAHDAAAHFRPTDTRDAVYDAAHSLQVSRVNLLDIVGEWDRADAHLIDGARTDQADQLLHVFTSARAAYIERDCEMLIDHIAPLTVAQCRIVAGHWAARVDAEAVAAGETLPPPPEPTISELRIGEISTVTPSSKAPSTPPMR